MQADLQLIKQRLFDYAREKIARDYGFDVPDSPEELSQEVLQSIDQQAVANPLNQEYSNDVIFHAVVRTIGSNSRKWTTYLNNSQKIAQILSDFCVEEVDRNPPSCFELASLLPGQSQTADACAILSLARKLSERKNYYASIVQASTEIQNRFYKHEQCYMPMHKLFLSVVAYFTDPSNGARSRKWPGMGFPLGSEFLRNLHWNGFKPDRHIKRILNRWTNDSNFNQEMEPLRRNVQQELESLQRIIDRRNSTLSDDLRLSLIGMEITPENHKENFSQFDNLMWLLASYVEKKGKESQCNYVRRSD